MFTVFVLISITVYSYTNAAYRLHSCGHLTAWYGTQNVCYNATPRRLFMQPVVVLLTAHEALSTQPLLSLFCKGNYNVVDVRPSGPMGIRTPVLLPSLQLLYHNHYVNVSNSSLHLEVFTIVLRCNIKRFLWESAYQHDMTLFEPQMA